MKIKLVLTLSALLCFGMALVRAQEQSGSPAPAQVQNPPSVLQNASLDNQGVKRYLLGPGDTLDVRVYGQSDLNWTGEVDVDGTLTSLPFIETPIVARCRTDRDVQKDIAAAYGKFLKNPQVSVRVTGRNSHTPAVIFGAVRSGSRFQMQRRVRLNELIAQSGGITEQASGTVQILHTEPPMCPEPGDDPEPAPAADGTNFKADYAVYRIADLRSGKPGSNPVIRPGDIITVTEAPPVYMTGSVVTPRALYLKDQMTLSRAMAEVGGTKHEAKDTDVTIYRQKPGEAEQKEIHVNWVAIKKGAAPDIPLQEYDVIDVPEASLASRKRIGRSILAALTGGAAGVTGSAVTYLPLRVIGPY